VGGVQVCRGARAAADEVTSLKLPHRGGRGRGYPRFVCGPVCSDQCRWKAQAFALAPGGTGNNPPVEFLDTDTQTGGTNRFRVARRSPQFSEQTLPKKLLQATSFRRARLGARSIAVRPFLRRSGPPDGADARQNGLSRPRVASIRAVSEFSPIGVEPGGNRRSNRRCFAAEY
jgi:hypothetical protein